MSKLAVKQPPHPIVTRIRWNALLIWLVPVVALGIAGYYLYDYLQDHGTLITIKFRDGSGLKPGETIVAHLGVQIGQVETVRLSPDQSQVLVGVRLGRAANGFARGGSLFWIVRPEVSTESISGLGTITSGPFLEAAPGSGDPDTEFTGLEQAPKALGPGLTLTLHAVRLERLQRDSPVYYHGIQVGVIQNIELGSWQISFETMLYNIEIFNRLHVLIGRSK